jgi:hypothetical protein
VWFRALVPVWFRAWCGWLSLSKPVALPSSMAQLGLRRMSQTWTGPSYHSFLWDGGLYLPALVPCCGLELSLATHISAHGKIAGTKEFHGVTHHHIPLLSGTS